MNEVWIKVCKLQQIDVKICVTVNKVDVVILDFCKKFCLDFKMYNSLVYISILIDLVCF